MRLRFTKTQILGFLREAEAGVPVMDLCWNNCFSRATFRAWKAKYGEQIEAKTKRLKQLEAENARLRRALVSAEKSSSSRARIAGVTPDRLGRRDSLPATRTFT
jgi:putative transposase